MMYLQQGLTYMGPADIDILPSSPQPQAVRLSLISNKRGMMAEPSPCYTLFPHPSLLTVQLTDLAGTRTQFENAKV